MTGTEWELVNPVAGDRVADVLGAVAAIAPPAGDVLRLDPFTPTQVERLDAEDQRLALGSLSFHLEASARDAGHSR